MNCFLLLWHERNRSRIFEGTSKCDQIQLVMAYCYYCYRAVKYFTQTPFAFSRYAMNTLSTSHQTAAVTEYSLKNSSLVMAMKWLSRIKQRGSVLGLKPPSFSASFHVSHQLIQSIIASCDHLFSRLQMDGDTFHSAAVNALTDSMLQCRAKQILQSMIINGETCHGNGDCLQGDEQPSLGIAILIEAALLLEDALLPPDAVSNLTAVARNTRLILRDKAHQIRSFIDLLEFESRTSVMKWVAIFAKINNREILSVSNQGLLYRLSSFILLNKAYQRNQLLDLHWSINESMNGATDLGNLLLTCYGFLFLEVPEVHGGSDNLSLGGVQQVPENKQDCKMHEANLSTDKGCQTGSTVGTSRLLSNKIIQKQVEKSGLFWRHVDTASGPTRRYKHSSCVDTSKTALIIYAGLGVDCEYDDVWCLDITKCRWERPYIRGNQPNARHGHAAIVLADKLIVFGGRIGTSYTNSLQILDIAIWKWEQWSSQFQSGRRPEPREGHSMQKLENKDLIMFGGRSSDQIFNDLWKYSLTERSWTPLLIVGDIPSPRHNPVFNCIKDQLFVMACGIGSGNRGLHDCYLLEKTEADTFCWHRLPSLQSTTNSAPCTTGAIINEEVILLSDIPPRFGEHSPSDTYQFRTALHRYNNCNGVWESCEYKGEGPIPRSRSTLTTTQQNKAILFGGHATEVLCDVWILECRDQYQN